MLLKTLNEILQLIFCGTLKLSHNVFFLLSIKSLYHVLYNYKFIIIDVFPTKSIADYLKSLYDYYINVVQIIRLSESLDYD